MYKWKYSECEGLDFVLENYNRKIKNLLPPEQQSAETWLNINHNFDLLSDIHKNAFNNLNLNKQDNQTRQKHNLCSEIENWRVQVRKSGVFKQKELCGLDGTVLNKRYQQFLTQSLSDQSIYLKRYSEEHFYLSNKTCAGLEYMSDSDDE
ncbi:unnamed protein product [Didymodactylos carnosus]|uniref:Uncharacterized protein n=2 Tax=Didymodactylos carnosus TaxID=1234261 RepID=A0A814NLC1_9BILA|nr:unnamed protein product [Didymodactylos carnosus]CAF3857517.1 unnamed protein product [Didymodactylos carnosus]